MSIKLAKVLSVLKRATDVLSELEAAGVDVDRLIGISNAQGGIAKAIKTVITDPDLDRLQSGKTSNSKPKTKPKPRQIKSG